MLVLVHVLERFCSQNFLRLYAASSACSCSCADRKAHLPDGKAPCQGRTRKRHSLTSLLTLKPNKTEAMKFIFLHALNKFWAQNHTFRMGKHHASEGRRSVKIAPKKVPNVTSETKKHNAFMLVLVHVLERFCSQNFLRLYAASSACSCSCADRKT